VRNLAAGARRHPGGPVRYSSRTSTAAHSSSPSQDPELAGVIDGLPDHLPAAVALHQYRDRDGVSDRCAVDHAAMGTASPAVKVLVRLVLGSEASDPGTPHPYRMIQACPNSSDGRPAF
jgi:hypothetical protein